MQSLSYVDIGLPASGRLVFRNIHDLESVVSTSGGGSRFRPTYRYNLTPYEVPAQKRKKVNTLLAKRDRLQAQINSKISRDYDDEEIYRLISAIQAIKIELEKLALQSMEIAFYIEFKTKERRRKKDERDLLTIMSII